MLKFQPPLTAVIMIFIAVCSSAQAQQSRQIGNIASQAGGQSTGQMAAGASTTNGVAVGLSATDAFAEVQREDVGATNSTGKGFSQSSVAAPNQGSGAITPGGIGGGRGGFGGIGGFGRMFDNSGAGSAKSERPALRTRLRSAIAASPLPPAQIQRTASARFQTLASRPQLRGVRVNMQGRTAVIEGTVRSDSDRRMSELLMRLEPGISGIENRLTIQP